jgi:tetraacyldisaccharide 4'-kinase
MFDPTRFWYRPHLHWLARLLLPFSWLFYVITVVRRYYLTKRSTTRFRAPVIVVGNITVGGTGKTPLVIWLVDMLKAKGLKPGIVSRGAGGIRYQKAHRVSVSDAASEVGDEAILLFRRAQVPLFIGIDRLDCVQQLLQETDCNIVISDDGLQHYRLHRDVEIVVIDGARGFGNRQLLPAGPLREPLTRLNQVDFVVVNGDMAAYQYLMPVISQKLYEMKLEPIHFVSVNQPHHYAPLTAFVKNSVHAVAGIGHPARFFQTLNTAGMTVLGHAFPDHYAFKKQDIHFADGLPVIMTEKDAVKCEQIAPENCWYLKVQAQLDDTFSRKLQEICLI